MTETPEEDPKIIVDEDWKTQVQREKEELKNKQEPASSPDSDSEDSSDAEEAAADTSPPLPPASLGFLVTSLATQAMASMGQIPGEDGKPMPVNLDFARHYIDLIGVLEEKTNGNLDAEEAQFISETLHSMRMIYVSVKQQQS